MAMTPMALSLIKGRIDNAAQRADVEIVKCQVLDRETKGIEIVLSVRCEMGSKSVTMLSRSLFDLIDFEFKMYQWMTDWTKKGPKNGQHETA